MNTNTPQPIVLVTAVSVDEIADAVVRKLQGIEAPVGSNTDLDDPDDWVYGLKGLAEFLHKSTATVSRMRAKGTLQPATFNLNGTLAFSKKKVIKVLAEGRRNRRRTA